MCLAHALHEHGTRYHEQRRVGGGANRRGTRRVLQQSDLAEAHYNLAVSLDRMGNRTDAKKHYITAANLAPGNKVIWDSPPMREIGLTHDIGKKSYIDSTYRGF